MNIPKIPLGISDFNKLITGNYYFVDKSLFIRDILEEGSEVLLFPRPRRFGKTINLSMLHSFLEMEKPENAGLFNGLAISEHADSMAHQGRYPVISLTFKSVKKPSFQAFYDAMVTIISQEFRRHLPRFENLALAPVEEKTLKALCNEDAPQHKYENALAFLSDLLHRATGIKPWLLIDEYDTPLHAAYTNGYYKEAADFMRSFLTDGLKDNKNLGKGVLTGILRVAQESIFSGLNNLVGYTIFTERFSQYFGFTEEEVEAVMHDTNKADRLDDVRAWYNGYRFGSNVLYNPWSLLNFSKSGEVRSYWQNTSDNELARQLIVEENALSIRDLETLLEDGEVSAYIQESVVLRDLSKDAVWSLLAMSGYLRVNSIELELDRRRAQFSIPNQEVKGFYRDTVAQWLNKRFGDEPIRELLTALEQGDLPRFEIHLSSLVESILSYHDLGINEPEKVYQAFILGLLANLAGRYYVRSDRQSGQGRYDIALIPRKPDKTAFIFELKRLAKEGGEAESLKEALDQIERLHYATEAREHQAAQVIAIGIVVHGKRLWLESKEL